MVMSGVHQQSCCTLDAVVVGLQQCQMAANDARFKLRDLLALPMQRVLKYHLFLKVRAVRLSVVQELC